MQLASFIESHLEEIVAAWEVFARSITPGLCRLELRDHAKDILEATVRDMRSAQTDLQRSDKSKGQGDPGHASDRLERASTVHGVGRVASGFNLIEVVSEYRALRASVLQLWRQSSPIPRVADTDDITRFNESIDQSLAEAVRSYTERVDQSRQRFLAILAHDLRNPLACIAMSARAASHSEPSKELSLISSSARAIDHLVSDLIDFAGTGMGGTLPIQPAPMDLAPLCREVIKECAAAHPEHILNFKTTGDLTGDWDAGRLRQVLSNLLSNAIHYGDAKRPIDLTAGSEEPGVVVSVHNEGAPIPPDVLPTLFDPLVRGTSPEQEQQRRPGSIGLGLYIAREIATAHAGSIDVTSSAPAGTLFTVRLPRRAPTQ